MSASSPSQPSRPVVSFPSRSVPLLVFTLCIAALFMGAHALLLGHRIVFGYLGKLILEDAAFAAVIATTLIPAIVSCCLFLFAARLLSSDRSAVPQRLPIPVAIVILAVLYTPFYWVVGSGWLIPSPLFPGFVAGVFTKPLDSKVFFMIAAGIDTILIVVSLAIVCIRMHQGAPLAMMIAFVISVSTSYASFCFLHA